MSKYPMLLIQKSKHYTEHYLLKNEKDKEKVALNILKSWMDMGYLSIDKDVPKTFTEFCEKETGMTEVELKAINDDPKLAKIKGFKLRDCAPAETVKEAVRYLASDYQSRLKENLVVTKAKEAVKNKDGKTALSVLHYYKDTEYMSTEIIEFANGSKV